MSPPPEFDFELNARNQARVRRITSLLTADAVEVLASVDRRCQAGRELAALLRAAIPRGLWTHYVRQTFGIDGNQSAQLRCIGRGEVHRHFAAMTAGRRSRLTNDLPKLAKLTQLPTEHWNELVDSIHLTTISRPAFNFEVDQLLRKYGILPAITPAAEATLMLRHHGMRFIRLCRRVSESTPATIFQGRIPRSGNTLRCEVVREAEVARINLVSLIETLS